MEWPTFSPSHYGHALDGNQWPIVLLTGPSAGYEWTLFFQLLAPEEGWPESEGDCELIEFNIFWILWVRRSSSGLMLRLTAGDGSLEVPLPDQPSVNLAFVSDGNSVRIQHGGTVLGTLEGETFELSQLILKMGSDCFWFQGEQQS